GIAAAPLAVSLRAVKQNIFVTGPTTFLFFAGSASATGIPWDGVTAYCTQDTTRNSVNYLHINTGGTGYTGASNPPVIDIAPPSGGWRTATAIGVILGGQLTSVTAADHGNNYSTTPSVKVVAINGATTLPTVTANAPVGGQITGYTITNAGSGIADA